MGAPKGYLSISDPDRRLVEYDVLSCGHCQKVIFAKPGTASTVYLIPIRPKDEHDLAVIGRWIEEPGAFCRVCMRPICLPCHDVGTCRTWEQLIESMEAPRGRPKTPHALLGPDGRPLTGGS